MLVRSRQILLVASVLWLSWLTMMLVHEGGHVLGAAATGGTVGRVVWHPATISRTDVQPNPHPLIEVWSGPVVGSLLPAAIAAAASLAQLRVAYLFWAVAGFCLIANGVYIGSGTVHPVGDAAELVYHGSPRWPLGAFGLAAVAGGFWAWHWVSPRLGFGAAPAEVSATHAYLTFATALAMTAAGFAFGSPGT